MRPESPGKARVFYHFVTHTMLKEMLFYPTHTVIIAMDAFLGLVAVTQHANQPVTGT